MRGIKVLLIFLSFFILTNAFAAGGVNAEGMNLGDVKDMASEGGNAADDIRLMFKAIVDGITQYSDRIFTDVASPNGKRIFEGLAVIALAWTGIRVSLEGGQFGRVMSDLILTFFRIAIVYYFLHDGYNLIFKQGIVGTMTQLANMVSPTGFNTIEEGFYAYLTRQLQIVGLIIDKLKEMSVFEVLTNFLPTLFIVLVTGFISLIGSIISMIASLSIHIIIAITLALGPILIPWMLIEKTAFIFDGWLKYLISASLAKVVLALLTGVGYFAMEAVFSKFVSGGSASFLAAALGGATVSALVGYMMAQSTDIANGLISGGDFGIGRLAHQVSGRAGHVGGGTLSKGAGRAATAAGNKLGEGRAGAMAKNLGSGLKNRDLFNPKE